MKLLYIIIATKKTNKYREKIVILQSIRIIAIKSREKRAVIYTCRYSSGWGSTFGTISFYYDLFFMRRVPLIFIGIKNGVVVVLLDLITFKTNE